MNEQPFNQPEPYVSYGYNTPTLSDMNLVEMEDAYGQNQDSLEEQLDQIDHPLQQVDQIDHTLQQPNPTQPIEHPVRQE